jgi:hypothetical protein
MMSKEELFLLITMVSFILFGSTFSTFFFLLKMHFVHLKIMNPKISEEVVDGVDLPNETMKMSIPGVIIR